VSLNRPEKAAILSIAVNILLVALKYALAFVSGSIALIADAWHSLSDVFVSALVLAGVRISKKGLRVAAIVENAVALAISVLILIAAVVLVVKSLKPQPEEGIKFLPVVLVGTVICAAISRLIGQYKVKVGTEENSPSLKADGHHSLMDFYTTAVVAVGLLGQTIGLKLDSVAAVIVVLFVVRVGLEITVIAIRGLVQEYAFGVQDYDDTLSKVFGRVGAFIGKVVKLITGREVKVSWSGFAGWLGARKKRIAATVVLVFVAAFGLSGFFAVKPHEVALVTVFGEYVGSPVGPGLHYAPPMPIGRVYKVSTGLVQRIEMGFRSIERSGQRLRPISRSDYEWDSLHVSGIYKKQSSEAIMLTGDENLIDVNAVLKYTISDPAAYRFGIADKDSLIRAYAENVLRSIVGVMPIDSVLTGNRLEIEERARRRLQEGLDSVDAGIHVVSFELQDVHPPVEVVGAFREVASAKEDKVLTVNNAIASRNEKIPAARAKAYELISSSEAYRISKVLRAAGDADRFASLLSGYRRAKKVTEFRLYVAAVEQALAGKRKFIVSPDVDPGALDLRIFARGSLTSKSTEQKKSKY